jgi:hypothetical protein
MELCNIDGCRLIHGHKGRHDKFPTAIWSFLSLKDQKKINKAGTATPRGGEKGGYQNHVARSNKVIIPYEKLNAQALHLYKHGYVVRLLPEQVFIEKYKQKPEFLDLTNPVEIGRNAFVLYRTWENYKKYPPLDSWSVRQMSKNNIKVYTRSRKVEDSGHYILRLSKHGSNQKMVKGSPQGIFATEYADEETNYLCKCVLAYLIINTFNSPYTHNQGQHLELILKNAKLWGVNIYETLGTMRRGLTCCPLCLKVIRYLELHKLILFGESEVQSNAGTQIEGATRATAVNLFHLKPLMYNKLNHQPMNIGWGHAICNTSLGQRECTPLSKLISKGLKVGVIYEDRVETFGWMSSNSKIIRSPNGAVWIKLIGDMSHQELNFESQITASDN